MAEYALEFKPSALKELEELPSSAIAKILPKIEALGEDPRPSGCKKLKGGRVEWPIRSGEYRVVYTIDDKKQRVSITRVRNRKDVYD